MPGDQFTLAAPFFAFFAEGCVGADLARTLLFAFAMPYYRFVGPRSLIAVGPAGLASQALTLGETGL